MKKKRGFPLDELLAAHATGDERLTALVEQYGRDVAPASQMLASSTPPKRPKARAKKASGARLARPNDSDEVIETRLARLVGYARVSTDEQTTALQLDALRAAGCAVIHEDAGSGALRSRPGLDRAIADLAPGDTLVVPRLDTLGRSLRALLDAVEMLRERGVSLRSLTEQIDTGTAAGNMLYAVLGAAAQFERDVIRERTVAGLVAAKDRGERLGRRPALAPVQRREARIMLDRGESVAHVAHALRVGRSTIYRAIATE